jgi:dual-specificity kinase
LGQGTFGKVVGAIDTETNTRVAIKMIRAKYRASRIEIRVLQKLGERDFTNRKLVLLFAVMRLDS